MLSLFSTSSDKAGFRLQYMEVFNWGTFHNDTVFRISPQGNNSLLTGANASGKSTYIDALLTLMVPARKDRFYNQSSGVEKKGDRTEETYVLGHYGNIQREGEYSTSTQALRDKGTYSVLLASFANTDQKRITLFQLRWFTNGELKRAFGIAHLPLSVEEDFANFDGKGAWRKRLEKNYNANSSKNKIEFFDGPGAYAERLTNLLGMRSTKALALFNQVVGVKVLEDLDDFIRNSMLEAQDAEAEYINLRNSFVMLMDAKTNIEKAKEQIAQLTPIDDMAKRLQTIQVEVTGWEQSQALGAYWFAQKHRELAEQERASLEDQLRDHQGELKGLRERETKLREEERAIAIAIERDEVGSKIKDLEKEIRHDEKLRDNRKSKLDQYNKLARTLKLPTDPDATTFEQSREQARDQRSALEAERMEKDEQLRQLKNKRDDLRQRIEQAMETIAELQKSKNNIAGREADIRNELIAHLRADPSEIPFIGELVRVRKEEADWELSIEKILHHFALRLVVPDKYYARVNDYVNHNDLRGRILYQHYDEHAALPRGANDPAPNALIRKLEFKPNHPYTDWLEHTISRQYNYACVKDLKEFELYQEKAVTKEGLVKLIKGRHEKDDRPHIARRENYVLGWDNKDKIKLLQTEVRALQEKEKANQNGIRLVEEGIKSLERTREAFNEILIRFTKYDDIDWQTYAAQIQERETQKAALEATNDRVKALQAQLADARNRLQQLVEVDIKAKDRAIYRLEADLEALATELRALREYLASISPIDTTAFEARHPNLLQLDYARVKGAKAEFQKEIQQRMAELDKARRKLEDEVRIRINAFKQPDERILEQFKDWRADVGSLPDSTHLEFIGEYQTMLQKLQTDNLPKYENEFNKYLQETITNKVGDFRMFFENWADSIKENIRLLNDSLRGIDFRDKDFKTYIQIVAPNRLNDEVREFRNLLNSAIPNIREVDASIDGRKQHFEQHIQPLIQKLNHADWRRKVMEVRAWFSYKAEEFYQTTHEKFKTYENMGQLSGGEKAQLTYTILGSAIAYQFGLTKEGLQSNSFRFIAIDEAFKAQDEDKARYLITLCKQLHLQLLVVTPSDNIHIVENDISFVHFVERKSEKYSWLYDMPIEQFQEQRTKLAQS